MRSIQLLLLSVLLVLPGAACGGDSPTPTAPPTAIPPTLAPTLTVTSLPTATTIPTQMPPAIEPTVTPQPTLEIFIQAEEGQEIEPPIQLFLPEGWEKMNHMYLYKEVDDSMRLVPITLYAGPVTGGQGFIVLIWAFENVVNFNPITGEPNELNLHADGLRLLRLAVIEPDCVIGAYDEQSYTVGGIPATGAPFSVVGCAQTVDTRGWFAVLQQQGVNFAFYLFGEPISVMDGSAPSELQNILNTVTFHLDDTMLATPTEQGE